MVSFQVGHKYKTGWDCVYTIEVVKRTPKTIVYKESNVQRRAKLGVSDNGVEYIVVGRYSAAPVFFANQECAG